MCGCRCGAGTLDGRRGTERYVRAICGFFFFAGSAGQVAGACPDLSKERQWQSGNASRAKRQEWHSPNPGNDSFVARASPSYASVQDHAPIASSRFAIKLRPPKGDADFLRLGLAYLPDLLFDEGKHWQ